MSIAWDPQKPVKLNKKLQLLLAYVALIGNTFLTLED